MATDSHAIITLFKLHPPVGRATIDVCSCGWQELTSGQAGLDDLLPGILEHIKDGKEHWDDRPDTWRSIVAEGERIKRRLHNIASDLMDDALDMEQLRLNAETATQVFLVAAQSQARKENDDGK